ncbi:MAG: HEAT repeat domain-containing protein [Rubrivivax sp.]|nr:HEAT repeat domain-containing protein [Rubrivivax sp.]
MDLGGTRHPRPAGALLAQERGAAAVAQRLLLLGGEMRAGAVLAGRRSGAGAVSGASLTCAGPALAALAFALGFVLALCGAASASAAECREPAVPGRLATGTQLRYAVDFRSDARYSLAALFAGQGGTREGASGLAGQFSVSLRATMEMDSLGPAMRAGGHAGESGLRQVAVRLADVQAQVASASVAQSESSSRVAADLAAWSYLDVAADGRVRGITFAAGTHSASQGVLRALLGLVQVSVPETTDAPSAWGRLEEDAAGSLRTQYVRLARAPGEGNSVWRLAKTRSAPLPTQAPTIGIGERREVATQTLPAGTLQVWYDRARGLVLGISGRESQRTLLSRREVGNAESAVQFELMEARCLRSQDLDQRLSEAQADAAYAMPRRPLGSDGLGVAEREHTVARSTLGDDTTASVLQLLDKQTLAPEDTQAATRLYLKLKALLIVNAAASGAVVQRVAALAPANPAARAAVDALVAAGHGPAQAALRQLLVGAPDEATTLRLLRATARIAAPDADMVQALERLASSPASPAVSATASLALGVMAGRLREADAPRSDALVRNFVYLLESAEDGAARRQWLRVLGNTGAPAALPILAARLTDAEAETRATAVNALRWIDEPAVETRLAVVLEKDVSDDVRIAAARTLAARATGPGMTLLTKTFQRNASERVRVAVAELLWQERQQYPNADAAVRRAARADPMPDVRAVCQRLVGGA